MSLLRTYEIMCRPDLSEYLDEREVINLVGKEHFTYKANTLGQPKAA